MLNIHIEHIQKWNPHLNVVFSAYDSSDGSLIVSQVIAPPIYPSEVMDGIIIDIQKSTSTLSIDVIVDDANGVEAVQECVEENNVLHIEAVCEWILSKEFNSAVASPLVN